MADILVIFFDWIYWLLDSHRNFTLHSYTHVVYLHTQERLSQCDLFSTSYAHFIKTQILVYRETFLCVRSRIPALNCVIWDLVLYC